MPSGHVYFIAKAPQHNCSKSTRSSLPPLTPKKMKVESKFSSQSTQSSDGSDRQLMKNNFMHTPKAPKRKRNENQSRFKTSIKLNHQDLDNISEECESPNMLPELSKMTSSKRVQTPKLAKQYSNNMHPNF